MTASSFGLIVLSVSLNAIAQVALRKAMITLATFPPVGGTPVFVWRLLNNVYLWGGLGCYAIGILLWLAVLSSNEVSVAYPMLSIGYVIAIVLSFILLGEGIPPTRLVGIALICVGVVLITRMA